MTIAEPEMIRRLQEELNKLGWSNTDIADELLCTDATVSHWRCGITFPNIRYLRDLYEIGCDILYIITGEATRT